MFRSARLKLTAWYLMIIMLVSMTFSIVIYILVIREVERFARAQRLRIERRLRDDIFFPTQWNLQIPIPVAPYFDTDLVSDTRKHLIGSLLLVNGSIFVLSGWLGYVLAARTLRPIKTMIDDQNQFISDSSHELRTPLTSLKSAMEVSLRDKTLTIKDARTLIAESIEEVDKLQFLSDNLLQLAQYQKSNGNLIFAKLSTTELIQGAVKKIEPIARQKHITLEHAAGNYYVDGNASSLIDLLVILLDNAIKYSNSGETVTISSHKHDGMVSIRVKDHGIGIEKKDMEHIFDRFWRADSARSKLKTGGYGLGLSIAKRIVDMHRGTITVTSEPGSGSIFTVLLYVHHKYNIGRTSPFS